MTNSNSKDQKQRTKTLVKVYPLGILLISLVLNYFVFGVTPFLVSLPSSQSLAFVVVAAALLVANHTWLMTTTELTRLRFDLHATPEEWKASGALQADVPEEGWRELERRHNAHRNATENTVYFAILVGAFVMVSPPVLASGVWILGFAVGRLGHTFSYLTENTSLRGAFMSLSILAMYGMASYLVLSLVGASTA